MARVGNHRMKLSGTVPDDLALWVKQKIASGEFYNTSHVLERAIAQLRQSAEGRSKPSVSPPPNGDGKKTKGA